MVCLLPLTPQTRGILNARTLRKIKLGGAVINVARGGHVVAEDLIDALDSGHLAHAYLDVFEHEPLPHDDPLWTHPGVTITPHTAALTEPRTAMPKIVENIERAAARRAAATTWWTSTPAIKCSAHLAAQDAGARALGPLATRLACDPLSAIAPDQRTDRGRPAWRTGSSPTCSGRSSRAGRGESGMLLLPQMSLLFSELVAPGGTTVMSKPPGKSSG